MEPFQSKGICEDFAIRRLLVAYLTCYTETGIAELRSWTARSPPERKETLLQ